MINGRVVYVDTKAPAARPLVKATINFHKVNQTTVRKIVKKGKRFGFDF